MPLHHTPIQGFTLIGASVDGVVLDPKEAVDAMRHYSEPTHAMLVGQLQANASAFAGVLTAAQEQLAAALEAHARGAGEAGGAAADGGATDGELASAAAPAES